MHAIGRRDVGRPQCAENQRTEEGGHAEDIVEKSRSIRAKKASLVAHFNSATDHMVEAGVIGVKAEQAQ